MSLQESPSRSITRPDWLPDVAEVVGSVPYGGLIAAVLIVFAAASVGALAGRHLGRRLQQWTQNRVPDMFGGATGRIALTVRALGAAVVLAAFAGLQALGPSALLLIALALAAAVAVVGYQLARGLRLSRPPSAVLTALLFVSVVAGRFGGLRPLMAGLDRIAINLGQGRASLLDVVNALLLAGLLFALARGTIGLLGQWITRASVLDPTQRVLLQKLGQVAVVALTIVLGVDLLGIDLTALAVFSGAFGLALGFGLQKTIGNLLSGLILLMDRSIKPGDVIVVGDTFGWVNRIGVRAVSVLTRDGKEHLIPNEKLMTEEVVNWSYSDRNVRVHLGVGVAHDCDLRLAQRLVLQAAGEQRRVLATPAPVCWIKGFGEGSAEFDLRIWIDDPEAGIGNVTSDVYFRGWELFKEHGVAMPFPQRDLHLRSLPRGLMLPSPTDGGTPS